MVQTYDFTLVFIWLAFIVITAVVANSKGRSAFGWGILAAIFGVFALIVVSIMGKTAKGMKKCPECSEHIMIDAKVCKHCGYRGGL